MPSGSRLRTLTKALFASGLQCPKRLYLEYHEPQQVPDMPVGRQALADVGTELLDLARTVFPKSENADPDNFDTAVKETQKVISGGKPTALFDAAFRVDDLEIRTDIVIVDGSGSVEIYEVKAGTKVKTRHVRDLALQVYAIERCGWPVKRVWVLHVNPRYRHKGGTSYPVTQLLKNVDVTDKVRRQVARVPEQVNAFRRQLDEPGTRDLPTGTWCHLPFTCVYLPRCLAESGEHPLLNLPELEPELESQLHEQGIEALPAVPDDHRGLSPLQQRALLAVRENRLLVDGFVGKELRDVEYPLCFVDVGSWVQVLPVLEDGYPWQHMPFRWHLTKVAPKGEPQRSSFVADPKAEDPRPEFARTLALALEDCGTVMVYGPAFELRLRELLEGAGEHKAGVRAMLHLARFDLRQLIRAGAYHPGFKSAFELPDVHTALTGKTTSAELDIHSAEEAAVAFRKLAIGRTRQTTRDKAAKQIEEFGRAVADSIHAVYVALLGATVLGEAETGSPPATEATKRSESRRTSSGARTKGPPRAKPRGPVRKGGGSARKPTR